MRFKFAAVEANLRRAEFRWKTLRLLEQTSALGLLVCGVALLVGLSIAKGWLRSQGLAAALAIFVAIAALTAWLVLVFRIFLAAPDRRWFAAALEKINRRFMDRLNTLVFLQQSKPQPQADGFAVRIARQAQEVLVDTPPVSPFSPTRALVGMAILVAALAGTAWWYTANSPWQRLEARAARAPAPARPGEPSPVVLPTNNVEQKLAWGEVRITRPGSDLKVTKVDVVPLQIEAAANESLRTVQWFSAVNGGAETAHPLPPPTEPRSASYQPIIYLDEFGLSDWDVVTYYAKATTAKSNVFSSELYFLEVRPFREDVLKVTGGEQGQAYQTLSQMSSLINRQQQVVRETHHFMQEASQPENVRSQDRQKLAEAENELSGSTRHLYAEMAGQMENQPIGDALDNLAKAEQSLANAGDALSRNAVPQATEHERRALSELVAARKVFQNAVSDNPAGFPGSSPADSSPVADASKQLTQMSEFRNEAKAAEQFLQNLLEQQKEMENKTEKAPPAELPSLAGREAGLKQSLEDFQAQHPQALKDTTPAARAMSQAADSLQRRAPNAVRDTKAATRKLEALNQQLQRRQSEQQLADAYKLKRMLDRQAQALDRAARQAPRPADPPSNQLGGQARKTVEQLKKTVEQEPGSEAFGTPLREALSGDKKTELDARLSQLEQSQDSEEARRRAGRARDALADVSRAFDASQPESLRQARSSDALQPKGEDSFAQGMTELNSLIKQLQKDGKSSGALGKQGQQAFADLQRGLQGQPGEMNPEQALQPLQRMLDNQSLDAGQLRELMRQLQRFSAENSRQLAKQEDEPELNNIDPARLPPAYRGRIQKYFEKLSER